MFLLPGNSENVWSQDDFSQWTAIYFCSILSKVHFLVAFLLGVDMMKLQSCIAHRGRISTISIFAGIVGLL